MKVLICIFVSFFFMLSNTFGNMKKINEEYLELEQKRFVLIPHRGTYLMPFSFNSNANDKLYEPFKEDDPRDRGRFYRHLEAEFQISFSILINDSFLFEKTKLHIGYTQQSWWQVYNKEWSRQFREHNYSPELFARTRYLKSVMDTDLKLVVLDYGFVHQSNGQIQEISRSWNRFFLRTFFKLDDLMFSVSTWYRVPEDEEDDDNPDIERYVGHGELQVIYRVEQLAIGLKFLPGERESGGELSFSGPINEGLRWYVKHFNGYGNSLIDYNRVNLRTSIGFRLNEPILKD